jgi:hypothetical protein
MMMFMGSRVAFDVLGVMPGLLPWRVLKKAHIEGASAPVAPERIGLHGASRMMRCSNSIWKDTTALRIPKGRSRR